MRIFRYKQFILLILLFCLFQFGFSQLKSFNRDNKIFIDELKTMVEAYKKPEITTNYKKFRKYWDTGRFNENQMNSTRKFFDAMLYRKLNIDPYFASAIRSFTYIADNKFDDKTVDKWQKMASNLLQNSNKRIFTIFLKTTENLFKDNSIYRGDARRWHVNNKNFEFYYNKNFYIKFKDVNLKCTSVGDTLVVYETEGVFYPETQMWFGSGGKVAWERHDIPLSEMNVKLKTYKIKLPTGEYKSDSAILTYSKYFDGEVLGNIQDKLLNTSVQGANKKSRFPEFISYSADNELKGILGDKAQYYGGFKMSGKKISGENVSKAPATVYMLYKGDKKIKIVSPYFRIDPSKVYSTDADFTILHDSGNIYHPHVNYQYKYKRGLMLVSRGKKGLQRAPISDKYHNLDFEVDQILWNINRPYIDFDMTSNDQEAIITSNDYYREKNYEKHKGILRTNPIEKLRSFYIKIRNRHFTLQDYVYHLKTTKERIIMQIINLNDDGFLTYNPDNDSIFLSKKIDNYFLAHMGAFDYDVMQLRSIIAAKPNLELNLLNYDLKIEGVRSFKFSDSQSVIAIPSEQILKVKYNRQMEFDGMVQAGRFDFFGKKFLFKYDRFDINSPTIDSMRIYYPDEGGRLKRVKSVLSNINGVLKIDKKTNKSGRKNYPEYPIFQSFSGSEIRYDKPTIHSGAYNVEGFAFEVDPFTIDSLDNFTAAGLEFGGTFHSAGIFPDFRHKATIQKDFSLGFTKATPPAGLPMYGGKGTGVMLMNLSEKGFYGSGDIKYLGSTLKSEKILLTPKKAIGQSEKFLMPESEIYPAVSAINIDVSWEPYENQMNLKNGEDKIKVFKTAYDFDGVMTLTPQNIKGNGNLEWSEAIWSSKEMIFGKNSSKAEEASLTIFAADPDKIAFKTASVNGKLDFGKREGKFTSNLTEVGTYFPETMYATNMNDYKWDMNAKTIELKPNSTLAEKPYYVSTKPGQDSLKFEAGKALFDITTGVLAMDEVPYIDVADARIFPENGKVTIRKGAKMDKLTNAKILASTEDKFHNLYGCNLNINGKYAMGGNGNYDYVNKVGQKQQLYFDSIVVNYKDKKVHGYGSVKPENKFTLDTKIGYHGLMHFTSNIKPIKFTGFVKPLYTHFDYLTSQWARFKGEIDPQNVVIPMNDPRNLSNGRLSIGLYLATDTMHAYTRLFQRKRRRRDFDLIIDTGIFYFDHAKNSFFAGDEYKLNGSSDIGNYIQFNDGDGSIYTEGNLNFDLSKGDFKFNTAGSANFKEGDSTFIFDLSVLTDFPLPKEFANKLYDWLNTAGVGGANYNPNSSSNVKAVSEFVTKDKSRAKAVKTIKKDSKIPAIDELDTRLLLNNISFKWDWVSRNFISTGPLKIATLNGKTLNKTFEGVMTMQRKRSGDNFMLYIKVNNDEYVFFNFVRGVMYITTSKPELNALYTQAMSKSSTKTIRLSRSSYSAIKRVMRKIDYTDY